MTKRIYNTGDSTAFVRVEILEIHPERQDKNNELPQKEVSGKTLERERLIVTPQRLIIPPSGFQSVRMLWPGERNSERYSDSSLLCQRATMALDLIRKQ